MNIKQLLTHDYDLWQLIHEFKRFLRLHIEVEWVKSHQSLDIEQDIPGVLLNHDADHLATLHYSNPAPIPHRCFYFILASSNRRQCSLIPWYIEMLPVIGYQLLRALKYTIVSQRYCEKCRFFFCPVSASRY
jgi:hypothetical protein